MKSVKKRLLFYMLFGISLVITTDASGQRTRIRGFVEANTTLQNGKTSFGFGEQDLFITSDLNDNFSFLGESVFKYSNSSSTNFSVSIERIVIKYNFKGNHNLLIGKHHTPINYWNDNYHHGRVFFPTVGRPLLFEEQIIPIHTTGIALQGLNLGKLKFGYNILVGNGLGSRDISDNDKRKSVSATFSIKPVNNLQIGVSYYNDAIAAGSEIHGKILEEKIKQKLYAASISYFGNSIELLAEGIMANNDANSVGNLKSYIYYVYAGIKIKPKWIPYFRYDKINFQEKEIYFDSHDVESFVVGLRHEVNYLTVVKLEYQNLKRESSDESIDKISAQIAIGF